MQSARTSFLTSGVSCEYNPIGCHTSYMTVPFSASYHNDASHGQPSSFPLFLLIRLFQLFSVLPYVRKMLQCACVYRRNVTGILAQNTTAAIKTLA
jgi:hypothetical protein